MLFLDIINFELYEILVKTLYEVLAPNRDTTLYAIGDVVVAGEVPIDINLDEIEKRFEFIGFI